MVNLCLSYTASVGAQGRWEKEYVEDVFSSLWFSASFYHLLLQLVQSLWVTAVLMPVS